MFGIDEGTKIDTLFILFAAWFCLYLYSIAFKAIAFLNGREPDRVLRRLRNLDDRGDYPALIEFADWLLRKQPESADIKWAKARALYKLDKIKEAKALFEEIASKEPMWREDAQKYLSAMEQEAK